MNLVSGQAYPFSIIMIKLSKKKGVNAIILLHKNLFPQSLLMKVGNNDIKIYRIFYQKVEFIHFLRRINFEHNFISIDFS